MPRHRFERPKGQLVEITLKSPHLKANLLGDPDERSVTVYLPPGYDEGEQDYPLFVDLVGYTGSGFSHLNWKAFDPSVPQRLDALVESGAMGPVICAFPDCFTSLGGNQYIDSVAMGRWASFLVEDMIPALEQRFRVRRGRAHRGVFGKSSGGYGAMVHAMRHAEHWGAAACHSGDMGFDLVYQRWFGPTLDVLAKHDRSIQSFLEHLDEARSISSGEMHALMSLGMAATYDPDPTAYKGVRLPVDLHTCRLDEDAWARWLVHDPVQMIERAEVQEALKTLRGLWIDTGDHDQFFIHYGTRQLVERLEALDIPHESEEFDDNHSGVDYRMNESLPWMYGVLTGA